MADVAPREFWPGFFRALEDRLAAAAAEAPEADAWSAIARGQQLAREQLDALERRLQACREHWPLQPPSGSQLLEAWASLTELEQRCTSLGVQARELHPALQFVEATARASGICLRDFAGWLQESGGRELDGLQRLLDELWNNPGEVHEDWRSHRRPGLRAVAGGLDGRLTAAFAQLHQLHARATLLYPALAALLGDGALLADEGAHAIDLPAPASASARLATARLLLQTGVEALVERHRIRIVQVFGELLHEKRRQIGILQGAGRLRQASRALQESTLRFADLGRLSEPMARDPLLAGGDFVRVGSQALAACALLGAFLAWRRGSVSGLACAGMLALTLLLLAGYTRRAELRFRSALRRRLAELEAELASLEQRLQQR